MQENVYDRIHRMLSWKRIIGFNMLLFLVLVVPLSVRLAQEDTENRSSAAENEPLPSVVPPPSYPAEDPRVERVTQFFGKKGDTIVVLGSNFGDYQWDSKVYVGNVEAPRNAVVRWSNAILEVQIPDAARTGKVWVVINGRQATWEGSLLLTDVARAAQIGLKKISATQADLWFGNGAGITRGMVEIGHIGVPLTAEMIAGGSILSQEESVDSLGRKLKIEFSLSDSLTSASTDILRLSHPGIGALEVLRVEVYDQSGQLVPVYADPFNVKIQ